MQTRKRVYPSERKPAKWVSFSLLFLSAVILFSGMILMFNRLWQLPDALEENLRATPGR